jgi:tol-pal system protein YbgF
LGAREGDHRLMKTAKLLPTLLIAAFGAASLLAMAAPAFTQDRFTQEESEKRLQRIEKDLREIRTIVLQAKNTGQPVEVRTAASDSQIAAMQAKLDDIDQTVRQLNGQIEVLSHNLDMAKQDDAATKAADAALADRVDKLEKQVAVLTAPPAAPAAPAAGQLGAGGPDTAEAANPGDAGAAYTKAHELMLSGDYPGAAQAYQGFIDAYPNSPSVPAAHYWLGEIKYTQGDFTAAAGNLLTSIRGWPKTAWAPDAMVKLSLSLVQLNKAPDACGVLTEFDRHYPKAAPGAKDRAAKAKARAGCAG